MSDQGNNKLRIGQSSLLYDRQFNTANLPTSSSWIELTGTWKATVDGMVDGDLLLPEVWRAVF